MCIRFWEIAPSLQPSLIPTLISFQGQNIRVGEGKVEILPQCCTALLQVLSQMGSFHIVLSPFNIALFWLFFFSGYLYAHISYLEDNCPACLLLLSTDRNAFFELAGSRQKTIEVSTVFVLWKFEKDDYTAPTCCYPQLGEEPHSPFASVETIRELVPKCFP